MKQITLNFNTIRAFALVVLCTTLFSFSTMPGGEGFEIYLNNRLLVQRFGNSMNTVQTLQLEAANVNDELTIKYHHCGRVGKNRSLMVKNSSNQVIKLWNFTDGTDLSNPMNCKVKDLLELGKKTTTLNLYYSSSELPNGRLLASIVTSKSKTDHAK
jgi:hypothetical protein